MFQNIRVNGKQGFPGAARTCCQCWNKAQRSAGPCPVCGHRYDWCCPLKMNDDMDPIGGGPRNPFVAAMYGGGIDAFGLYGGGRMERGGLYDPGHLEMGGGRFNGVEAGDPWTNAFFNGQFEQARMFGFGGFDDYDYYGRAFL